MLAIYCVGFSRLFNGAYVGANVAITAPRRITATRIQTNLVYSRVNIRDTRIPVNATGFALLLLPVERQKLCIRITLFLIVAVVRKNGTKKKQRREKDDKLAAFVVRYTTRVLVSSSRRRRATIATARVFAWRTWRSYVITGFSVQDPVRMPRCTKLPLPVPRLNSKKKTRKFRAEEERLSRKGV